ncbi:hypothetical protein SAMN04490356_1141 [Streptomyces melanosporofaciens]|uniref:Uncharacterized protein n=1 Tax=Streptomyces melanosporofaciens TaxID=67327 RepID=A0A1H4L4H4_STRMJ|nr:hypothetical protein SAMN04490356_1141 [Streptomyces melanosporofaciens]
MRLSTRTVSRYWSPVSPSGPRSAARVTQLREWSASSVSSRVIAPSPQKGRSGLGSRPPR